MNKKAKNTEEAWLMQDRLEDTPSGWIQWKGTDVCMDLHCKCGYSSHLDGYFAYNVQCPKCGTIYMCNGHIELIELTDEKPSCLIIGEEDDD